MRNFRSKGFMLLEVMLALSIASVFLLFLIRAFSMIAQSHSAASHYTQALYLLEERLFHIQAQMHKPFPKEGIFEAPFELFHWRVALKGDSSQKLKKAMLAVFWNEGEQTKEIKINTYLKEQTDEEEEKKK